VAITEGFYNGQTITFGTTAPVGWGNNGSGQMGDGSTASPRSIPVATTVSGLLSGKNIASLAIGGSHTLALTSDNLLYTWGQGSAGQLGDGQPITSYSSSTPVAVTMSGVLSGKTIVAVACGSTHSLALDSAGLLYAWGNNGGGQLGDGTGTSGVRSNVPVAVLTSGVLSGKVITGIAGGSGFTIVCTSDGGVYTWGTGTGGQLGNSTSTTTNSPGAVTTSGVLSGKRVVAVSAGGTFAAVLTSDGRVYTWGGNNQGQLGDGTTSTSNVPLAVSGTGLPGGKTIANIFCGNQVVYALASDGTLYAWGNNLEGALGIGSNTSSSTPVLTGTFGALSGKTITTLGTGNGYAYALTTEGKVYSWGTNSLSQLGDGTTTQRTSPVAVDVSASSALNGKTVGFVSLGSQGSFGMVGISAAAATTAPTVTTPTQASVTHNSATLGGNVTADGGASISARGVVYSQTSLNSNPQLLGANVTNLAHGTNTTGVFTVNATGLLPGTQYSFAAYATNSAGTTYTSPVSTFTTVAAVAVSSLNTLNATPTNAGTVNWTLTFASAVTGLTASNLSLTGAAATGSTVNAPGTSNGGLTWNVPVTTGSTDGTLTLNLANATGLSAAISTTLPYAGQSYTIDKTPPTVLSVNRQTPSAQQTNNTSVVFRVTYSEPVTLTAPAANRFAVVPVGGSDITGSISSVTPVSPGIYDIGVNVISGTGEFRLRVID